MMALLLGRRGPVLKSVCRSSIFALALGLAAIAAPPSVSAASDIAIVLDEARLVKMPEKAATIVIGNPLIADATVQPGGLMVLTGKGYGTTNIIALDRAGAVLMEKTIEVLGPRDTVAVYRGIVRETYSCRPFCEPRIMLGDGQAFFENTIGQTVSRAGLAQGAGPAK
jgi:Flp pilus assembly secretin CpaC